MSLSLGGRLLYASCGGTGELRQYDVSAPHHPRPTVTARIGGMAFDPDSFLQLEDGVRPHQVKLPGGDASSDSFCYS